MKTATPEQKTVIMWFAILLVLYLLTSCSAFNLGKKTEDTKESITKVETTTETKKDSLTEVIKELNKAINNNLKIAVGSAKTSDQAFNRECNKIIDEILSQINVAKSSGGNNYKLYYDLEQRILELQLQIAETQNKETTTNTNSQTNTDSSTSETVIQTSKKIIKMLPWWVWLIVGVWFLPQILSRLQLIFNPLAAFIKKSN